MKLVLVIAPSEGVLCGVLNNIEISLIQSIVGLAVCSDFRSPTVILYDNQIQHRPPSFLHNLIMVWIMFFYTHNNL